MVESCRSYGRDEIVRLRHCRLCGHEWITRELYAAKLTDRIPRTPRHIAVRDKETPNI